MTKKNYAHIEIDDEMKVTIARTEMFRTLRMLEYMKIIENFQNDQNFDHILKRNFKNCPKLWTKFKRPNELSK